MDALTDALSVGAVRGSVSTTVLAADPWGLSLAQMPVAAFHSVTAGTAYVAVDGGAPLRLSPGDSVLLPRGAPHTLTSAPDAPIEPFDPAVAEAALVAGTPMRLGEGVATTRILCAKYLTGAGPAANPFAHLPSLVHIPAAGADEGLRATLRLLSSEVGSSGVGTRVVLDHVVSVLLVQILRHWLATGTDSAPSWLRGLADPVTAAALAEVHGDPAADLTTASLARRVGVSPATLQRRFADHVGCGVAEYVTGWRMEVAAKRLRSSDEAAAVVARAVGYRSEFAFNRAFRRHHGTPPGRYRRSTDAA